MGLLSNPSAPPLNGPLRKPQMLAIPFYVISILWMIALANRQLNSDTYFSENALLPGLVNCHYREESLAQRYLLLIQAEAERYPNSMPHAFLAAQFKQLGIDTYTHNFSMPYPLGDKIFTGKNVYGIMRAPRGASTEALVMSAPYRPPESTFTGSNAGIAMMLSLAASFRKTSYWARDIIFLITEHEQLGMEAWLEAYHHTPAGGHIIDFGQLDARGGAIQAALNLELPSSKISHIDIRMEGLNGQLPNLDLVNLAHHLFRSNRFTTTLKEREDPVDSRSLDGWIHSAVSLLTLMTSQASGVPTGNHGLFHRFGIEAITVAGSYQRGSRAKNFNPMGKALEGIMRSLNNLQERFHQSFFFYLMPATNRYISIGVYMPPFGLMVGCLLVRALGLYFKLNAPENQRSTGGFTQLLPILFMAVVSGLVFHSAPEYLIHLNKTLQLRLSTEDGIFGGLCILSIVHWTLFAYLGRLVLGRQNISNDMTHCAVLLLMSTLMFSVAMGNISLAFLTSLAIVPAFSLANPVATRLSNVLRYTLMILVHPMLLLFVVTLIDTYRVFPEDLASPLHFVNKAFVASQRALVYAIVDDAIYGNWLFTLATSLYLPLWSVAWANLNNLQ